MEEEKAAAYYDELTRKGGGAARFKQGLGFSSATSNDAPSIGSALPFSSSSFMSNFVRASSPTKGKEIEKKTQIENIQNKLKKKEPTTNSIDASNEKTRVRVRDRRSRSRSRSRERERGEDPRRDNMKTSKSKNRSLERRKGRNGSGSDEERERSRRRYRSPSKERRRERSRERRRRRRSRSLSDGEKKRGRNRERNRSKSRSRSPPRDRKQSGRGREARAVKKEGNVAVDYAKLIDGYDKMTPAEKVKAKMKLQLSQTAEKDTKMGIDSQWERFDFNKDAPVDDAEIEAADDDVALVKQIGKSFRFTSLEGKREDEIKNAHDEAMFGAPAPNLSNTSESGEEKERENEDKETNDDASASSLINEKVIWKQQGSWRDRARRNVV